MAGNVTHTAMGNGAAGAPGGSTAPGGWQAAKHSVPGNGVTTQVAFKPLHGTSNATVVNGQVAGATATAVAQVAYAGSAEAAHYLVRVHVTVGGSIAASNVTVSVFTATGWHVAVTEHAVNFYGELDELTGLDIYDEMCDWGALVACQAYHAVSAMALVAKRGF